MKKSFSEWLKEVDRHVAKYGLSMGDLPDVNYRDWYDDGVSAKSAASKAIKNARSEM